MEQLHPQEPAPRFRRAADVLLYIAKAVWNHDMSTPGEGQLRAMAAPIDTQVEAFAAHIPDTLPSDEA